MTQLAIAIDGGHSMFKIRAARLSAPDKRISIQIPTVVMPAIQITNDQTRRRAEQETVELDGCKYYFGETAIRQGRAAVYTGQNGEWIESVTHDVLLLGAWQKVMQAVGSPPSRIHLAVGLPAKYYAIQKEALRQRVLGLLMPLLLPGQSLKVMVQNQAEAPLQWLAIHANGLPNRARNLEHESWGVIEIGHYTTDFALLEYGSMIEHATVSCPGARIVHEALAVAMAAQNIPATLNVLDEAIRNRQIVWYGQTRNVGDWVDAAATRMGATVMDEAERLFGDQAGVLNGIIVGGGAAELLFKRIHARFPTAAVGDAPRMMVAEGFCRLALMSLIRLQIGEKVH